MKGNGQKTEHWHGDLVTNILLRLPVKSVIRFKCVAKTWSSLIENPSFVSQHLSNSKEANNSRLLVYHFDSDASKFVFRLFLDQTLVSYQDLFQQIPQHADTYDLELCVYDGLLCMCHTLNNRISLWNPATKEFRFLPECNEDMPPRNDTFIHEIGFGSSNSLLDDYKVIYFRDYLNLETGIGEPRHHAVYRMRSNSWRVLNGEDVDSFRHLSVIMNRHKNTCVNGVYYFQGHRDSFRDPKVIGFHFSNEVFEWIDWPPVVDDDPNNPLIGDLLPLPDNRISVWVTNLHPTNNRCNDVWVLNEESHDWSILLRIGHLEGIEMIFGFRNKNCDKIYVESSSGQLLIYDFDTQEYRDIGIKTGLAVEQRLQIYSYEESLIRTGRNPIE